MSKRTIAIGDIHGYSAALAAVLEAIEPHADDRIVVLGDCVDRGPDSRGVIDRLLELRTQCELITLMGNHEQMMLRGLRSLDDRHFWLQYGGRETLASYGKTVDEILPEHIAFIENFRPYFETATHLFIHANYDPDLPFDRQEEAIALWTHLGDRPPAPHRSGKTVVVGHTPQLSGEVRDFGHLICLDTFCFGSGWLTAMDVGSKDIWQADRNGRIRTSNSSSSNGNDGIA